jgi:hypothetical protein
MKMEKSATGLALGGETPLPGNGLFLAKFVAKRIDICKHKHVRCNLNT